MITDNATNIIYFSEILQTDSLYRIDLKHITKILNDFQLEYRFLKHSKDIWARDYMPIQVSIDKFIEYRYDPDYLQGTEIERREVKTYPDIVCDALQLKTIKTDIILDGGNVIKSSNCVILTDKVVIENKRNYTQSELIEKLKQLFEVENVILIPWDKEEEFGHADGMVRFIDDENVLLNGYFQNYKNEFKQKLYGSFEQNNLKWNELKFNVKNENYNNWIYINYLQTKDLILIPKLGIDEDEQAFEQFKEYFPDYAKRDRIRQVEIPEIIKGGGALNCISWTVLK